MPRLLRIDAFTSKPFRGNPAAVVPDAGGLDEKQMQTIAREMNISETAFLLPSDQADFRLRWFTPHAELVFCGHGTIATAHVLFEEGRFGTGRFAAPGLVFETLGGPVVVDRFEDVYFLTPGPRNIRPFVEQHDGLMEVLGLAASDIADWAKPAVSPENALMIFCHSLDALRRVRPGAALVRFGEERGIRSICLTTRETMEPASAIHSRYFSLTKEIREDPVTGSVHASLAVYLHKLGVVPERFVAEQGDIMGRPGRLLIEADGPRVGGRAVTVFTGELYI